MKQRGLAVGVVAAGVLGLVLVLPRPRAAAPASARASAAASPATFASTGRGDAIAAGSVRAAAPVGTSAADVGELVGRADQCEAVCGSECVRVAGALHCPKRCKGDGECRTNTLCVYARAAANGAAARRCLGAECSGSGADAECGEHKTCRAETHGAGVAFRCVAAGDRKAGEPCADDDAFESVGLCAVGLTCVDGTCAPPTCAVAADCPRGTRCAPMGGGLGLAACIPTCDGDDDCGADEACVTLRREPVVDRECIARSVVAQTCLADGCAAGQRCVVELQSKWLLQAHCHATCAAGGSGCGAGEFCDAPPFAFEELAGSDQPICYARCTPGGSDCPAGWVCARDDDGRDRCQFPVATRTRDYFAARYP